MQQVVDAAQTVCSVNGWAWLQGPLIAFAAAFGVSGFMFALSGTPLIRITKHYANEKK